jgi:TolB-like protein/Tfp pilus assembly protein PilF
MAGCTYRFGPFRLDVADRVLLCGHDAVPLPPKALDMLIFLVENRGRLLGKEELMNAVWAGTFVEEGNLSYNISVLRKALGENPAGQPYIQTVSKRGYRFLAETVAASPQPSDLLALSAGGRTIAVLPFVDLSPQRDHEYFSDGLTVELLNALTKIPELRVVARSSSFQFKDAPRDVRKIGQQLNVCMVLEGSVRRDGNRLRITAQLSTTVDGYHSWSETYDRDISDVFAVQEEIAQAIVSMMSIRLADGTSRKLVKASTKNLEAYQLYLKGRYFSNKLTSDGIQQGLKYYQQAISQDPLHAAAWAGMSDAYGLLAANSLSSTAEALRDAKAAAGKALEIDETLAEAHSSLGYIKHHEWDWRGAEKEFRRAIQLNPSYPIAYHWLSHNLIARSRTEESLAASRRALELDPLDLLINLHLAWHYYFAREYESAVEQCQRTLEMDPNFTRAQLFLGLAYEQMGMFDVAIASFRTAIAASGGGLDYKAALGHALANSGRLTETRQILRQLQNESNYVSPYVVALLHVALGENETAFEWLQKAYDEKSTFMTYVAVDPRLAGLRSDVRFTEILKKVDLPRT